MRKKQLHVLFTAIHELQNSLDFPDGSLKSSSENSKPLVDLTDDVPEMMDCTPAPTK